MLVVTGENDCNLFLSNFFSRVLRGLVVKCLTHNPGVLGSSRTGSSGILERLSLGKTLQSPSLVLKKRRKDMDNVSCLRDVTGYDWNTVESSVKHHTINHLPSITYHQSVQFLIQIYLAVCQSLSISTGRNCRRLVKR